jgi:PTH1 family peptidyl-tRNA hydrolase
MFLIVGLGNTGERYEKTRHNIGFRVIDRLIDDFGARDISKNSFYGKLYKANRTLFLKPTTFVNLSGKSVIAVKNFYKINMENIIVVHDDIDLPFSALRIKRGGGNGGHNGLKSIDKLIGRDYIRVRMGIGRPANKSEIIGFVLNNFTWSEERVINRWIEYTVSVIKELEYKKIDEVKSKYSLKPFRG